MTKIIVKSHEEIQPPFQYEVESERLFNNPKHLRLQAQGDIILPKYITHDIIEAYITDNCCSSIEKIKILIAAHVLFDYKTLERVLCNLLFKIDYNENNVIYEYIYEVFTDFPDRRIDFLNTLMSMDPLIRLVLSNSFAHLRDLSNIDELRIMSPRYYDEVFLKTGYKYTNKLELQSVPHNTYEKRFNFKKNLDVFFRLIFHAEMYGSELIQHVIQLLNQDEKRIVNTIYDPKVEKILHIRILKFILNSDLTPAIKKAFFYRNCLISTLGMKQWSIGYIQEWIDLYVESEYQSNKTRYMVIGWLIECQTRKNVTSYILNKISDKFKDKIRLNWYDLLYIKSKDLLGELYKIFPKCFEEINDTRCFLQRERNHILYDFCLENKINFKKDIWNGFVKSVAYNNTQIYIEKLFETAYTKFQSAEYENTYNTHLRTLQLINDYYIKRSRFVKLPCYVKCTMYEHFNQ